MSYLHIEQETRALDFKWHVSMASQVMACFHHTSNTKCKHTHTHTHIQTHTHRCTHTHTHTKHTHAHTHTQIHTCAEYKHKGQIYCFWITFKYATQVINVLLLTSTHTHKHTSHTPIGIYTNTHIHIRNDCLVMSYLIYFHFHILSSWLLNTIRERERYTNDYTHTNTSEINLQLWPFELHLNLYISSCWLLMQFVRDTNSSTPHTAQPPWLCIKAHTSIYLLCPPGLCGKKSWFIYLLCFSAYSTAAVRWAFQNRCCGCRRNSLLAVREL